MALLAQMVQMVLAAQTAIAEPMEHLAQMVLAAIVVAMELLEQMALLVQTVSAEHLVLAAQQEQQDISLNSLAVIKLAILLLLKAEQ